MILSPEALRALEHLQSFGLPFGGQGPGTRAYWKTLDDYLATYVLTWPEIPDNSQGFMTWENGSKKAKFIFTRSYRNPDPRPVETGTTTIGPVVHFPTNQPGDSPQGETPMIEENKGPAPATFPADEATQEMWDLDKKFFTGFEFDVLQRSRAFYDQQIQNLISQSNQLFSANFQMLTNMIQNSQRTEARANRHDDLAATVQWRDRSNDDFPNSQVTEGDVGEGED